MKCSICQCEVIQDIEKQKQSVKMLLEYSVKTAPDIIVFPELFLTGYFLDQNTMGEIFRVQEGIFFLGEIAQKYDCLALGGIVTKRRGKYYNSAIVVSQNAEILLNYPKVHLYEDFHEGRFFNPGSEVGTFDLSIKVGSQSQRSLRASVLVCYDLVMTKRDPSWLSRIQEQRPEIVFVIAQWPKDEGGMKGQGIKSWRILNSRLSREVRCPVIAVNRYGKAEDLVSAGDIFFAGHSGFYDYSRSSAPIKEAREGEKVLTIEVENL